MSEIATALPTRWNALWTRLGAAEDRIPALQSLVVAYESTPRPYHNLSHVRDCLKEFAIVRHLARHPDAIGLAIWYHDAIYDATRRDNEERSADMAAGAMRSARLGDAVIDEVVSLIIATKHTSPPSTEDSQLLVDIDLSILGRPWDEFETYERAIRQEYAHVDESDFRAGRASILRRFLDRPAIFGVADMRERFEATARANLKKSVALLNH